MLTDRTHGSRHGGGGNRAVPLLHMVLTAILCALVVLNLHVRTRSHDKPTYAHLGGTPHPAASGEQQPNRRAMGFAPPSGESPDTKPAVRDDAGKGAEVEAPAGAEAEERLARRKRSERLPVPEPWPYTCWEPKAGLSEPILTVLTVAGGLAEHYSFMQNNRLHYAAMHGYRYCELKAMDTARVAAWTKLPAILAMLPCSDFVYHLDADALFTNHTLSLEPWMSYMEQENLDLLLPADKIRESPLNFGVFMVRRGAPWVYTLFQALYNRCTCAWGIIHDWPAEQGMLYDLIIENKDGPPNKHSRIIPARGWNHLLAPWEYPEHDTIVSHVPHPPQPEDADKKCKDEPASRPCKYKGVRYFWDRGLKEKKVVPYVLAHPDLLMDKTQNHCRDVIWQQLVEAHRTYFENSDRYGSSVLDLIVQPDGSLHSVHVSEVACIGWRDKKCDLKEAWNRTSGTGPIMPLKDVKLPPRTHGPILNLEELYKQHPHQKPGGAST